MPEPTDRERIEGLEEAGRVHDQRIGALEAADLVFDERIIALAHEVDGLQTMIESRAIIEQAKGVIMSSVGCGPDAPFGVLVAKSKSETRKVREIAAETANPQPPHPKSN